MKHTFQISYDDGVFWHNYEDADNMPYQAPAACGHYDELANGFKWGMSVKGKGQRKLHPKSLVTSSIVAMLDSVRDELKRDPSALVVCHTPDVELCFFVG